MILTGEEVLAVIKKHKLTIERDHSLEQKAKNQQIVAFEAAMLKVRVAEQEKSEQEISDESGRNR